MYFKVLDKNFQSYGIQWKLPTKDSPGEWMPYRTEGFFLLRKEELREHVGPYIFAAEAKECPIVPHGIVIAHRVRLTRWIWSWDEIAAILYAIECVEHVLPLWQEETADDRPEKALEAVLDEVMEELSTVSYETNQRLRKLIGAAEAAENAADWASSWQSVWPTPVGYYVASAAACIAYAAADSTDPWSMVKTAVHNANLAQLYWGGIEAGRQEETWQTELLMSYLGIDKENPK